MANTQVPHSHARKICAKKGLKVGKTQSGSPLRNPVYIGKNYILKLDHEPGYLADGIHQGLTFEKKFSK
ncbi:hypothetical protein PARA125_000137 [Parachlamydia sp. AcF125]|nr:hypothetical protein [Parachlamydia sp. AcF125]